MSAALSRFVVGRTTDAITRKCPFCGEHVQDGADRDINFAVHLGSATQFHRMKQDWADYVSYINRV